MKNYDMNELEAANPTDFWKQEGWAWHGQLLSAAAMLDETICIPAVWPLKNFSPPPEDIRYLLDGGAIRVGANVGPSRMSQVIPIEFSWHHRRSLIQLLRDYPPPPLPILLEWSVPPTGAHRARTEFADAASTVEWLFGHICTKRRYVNTFELRN